MPDPDAPEIPPIFARLDQCAPSPYTPREYAARLAWEWTYRLFFRPSPRRAYRWRAFLLRRFGAKIAPTARIRPSVNIVHPWLLTVGDYGTLGDDVSIYNLGPVTIGDHATVSQHAYLCAGSHDYTKRDTPLLRPPITIGGGAWVCTGAYVGPGVNVGVNAIVAARAVVVKDVPPGTIVGGNPAKAIGMRDQAAD